jgi:predicted double-glycine peptidase
MAPNRFASHLLPALRASLGFLTLALGLTSELGAQPVRSLLEIRHENVVIQTWDTSCAAAALATVLTYIHHDPVSEKAAAQAMLRKTEPLRVRARGGFSLLDMKRFAETRGYSAVGFRHLSLEELAAMPGAIVPIEEYSGPHFVVVRGMHDGLVDMADPAFGNRRVPVNRFLEVWREGIGFSVTRPKA